MAATSQGQWTFRSARDVSRFWDRQRTIASRADGRKPYHEERFYLGLYLLALARHGLLSFPLRAEQRRQHENPDFMLKWDSGEITGLEITRPTQETVERAITANAKQFKERERKATANGGNAAPIATLVSACDWLGDRAAGHWCELFRTTIDRKLKLLDSLRPANRYDLLIFDEGLIGVDRQKVFPVMHSYLESRQQENPRLGKTSVVISLDVFFDVGGECRMLPYVEWSGLKPAARSSIALAKTIEEVGQVAVGKAIQRNADLGIPLHFMDSSGRLIRKMPDGRCFELKLLDSGEEVIIREL